MFIHWLKLIVINCRATMRKTSKYLRMTNKKCTYKFITITFVVTLLFIWIASYLNISYTLERCQRDSFVLPQHHPASEYDHRWTWTCTNDVCSRERYEHGKRQSLQKCNMMCGFPQLWPKPQIIKQTTKTYSPFYLSDMNLKFSARGNAGKLMKTAYELFKENIAVLVQPSSSVTRAVQNISVTIEIILNDLSVDTLKLDTVESYTLKIGRAGRDVLAVISARNFFGARHGLETLSQLIWFDNVDRSLNIVHDITIDDYPAFPYRGLMVDTARNYFTISLLKKVIRGMAANKLNVFHWHMTDVHSFPFQAPSFPDLAKHGSYSPSMIYTYNDVQDIVQFAKLHGIRVLIEIDAPAHTYSGWRELDNFTIVANDKAAFGQLNPENPSGLRILKKLYRDVLSLMDNNELFHIGGDEVEINMWNVLQPTFSYASMMQYWEAYVVDMLLALRHASKDKVEKVIMWSSDLSERYSDIDQIDKNSTIIQFWFGQIDMIAQYGYGVIFSNVGLWYLDCGFGKYQESTPPSCNPYVTWQTMYMGTPWTVLENRKNVYGGEVCMWTEMVGADSLETRIWPRSAAFAERIWRNPSIAPFLKVQVPKEVYTRLDTQRERMASRNIKSEVFRPRYCTLNPDKCG